MSASPLKADIAAIGALNGQTGFSIGRPQGHAAVAANRGRRRGATYPNGQARRPVVHIEIQGVTAAGAQPGAKARIQACENRLNERSRAVFRSADDHYNISVAFLNRGETESALNHLQQALKLAPKGDHILYALAAANALQGNKDQALSYLKQSIHYRPENRFQAAQDTDFGALVEEPEFRELITPPEKSH